MTSAKHYHVLNRHTANPHILSAEYAVRGPIVIRAVEIQQKLKKGDKLPFEKVVFCNIGNPQIFGSQPITFYRQVLAACNYPPLALEPNSLIPDDARKRALHYLNSTDGFTIGAYTHSQGVTAIRQDVAHFLEARDGFPISLDHLFLTDGASSGIKAVLQLIISKPNVGVMIPIPQYPLYSATISMAGGRQVGYYLDESKGWGMDVAALETAITQAKEQGTEVRAICIINPGNPTGACISEETIRDVIEFAHANELVIIADEVYQSNVYDNSTPFTSFRKVLHSMKFTGRQPELFSFHSTSKGLLGECGYRGGFMALDNIDPFIYYQLYKTASVSLCPNVSGQVMTGLMCNPPRPGDESYELYERETTAQYESLKRRAAKTTEKLNSVPGISCVPVGGAMYAFPSITLPDGAFHEAARKEMAPDTMFAMDLLEETGVCVVPGSGFGQSEDTYHFRTTILPPEEDMDRVLDSIVDFYKKFCERFA